MPSEETFEHHSYDVVVIGAGGAGLRAAIVAHDAGARTALVCRSLLGKAHTVMAEGGIAAALGNLWPEDNWQVHFRDTMRGASSSTTGAWRSCMPRKPPTGCTSWSSGARFSTARPVGRSASAISVATATPASLTSGTAPGSR